MAEHPPADLVLLRPGGIGSVDFGAPADEAIAQLSALLGPPDRVDVIPPGGDGCVELGGWLGCLRERRIVDEGRLAVWEDKGLEVALVDTTGNAGPLERAPLQFGEWHATGPSGVAGLATEEGLSTGMTVGDLRQAAPNVEWGYNEGLLDSFHVSLPAGGGYWGRLDWNPATTAVDFYDLRAVQAALNDHGADLVVDGEWGPRSEAAWLEFLTDLGIEPFTTQPWLTPEIGEELGLPPDDITVATIAPRPPIEGVTTAGQAPDTEAPMLVASSPQPHEVVDTEALRFSGATEVDSTLIAAGRYPVPVGDDGTWSTVLMLRPGGNTATFTATDPAGNETTVHVPITYQPPVTELRITDTFEQYEAGSYPADGAWYPYWSGESGSVSDDRAHGGQHSFRLVGYGGWVRTDALDLDLSNVGAITYRVAVNCSSENLAGAEVGFLARTASNESWMFNSWHFKNSHDIYVKGDDLDGDASPARFEYDTGEDWEYDAWYVVEARIDYRDRVITFWLDGRQLTTEVGAELVAAPPELSSVFALANGYDLDGVTYFDDLEIVVTAVEAAE